MGERDTLFHLILADASGSQRLVTEVAELRSRAYQVSALWDHNPISTLRLSNREHRTILRAVKARQPSRAEAAMKTHVQTTLAVWLGLEPGLAHDAWDESGNDAVKPLPATPAFHLALTHSLSRSARSPPGDAWHGPPTRTR